MTGPDEPGVADHPTSVERSTKRPLWKRLLTVPGILITTALTAAVSWAVSLGLTQLSTSTISPHDAVAITTETDPGRISGLITAGRAAIFPLTTKTTGDPGAGCDGFYEWSVTNGGIDANISTVQVVVQGKVDGAVLLNAMRVKVIAKNPPVRGIIATCPTAGNAQRRSIEVNLDSSNQNVVYKSSGVASPFGFTLAKGETEAFIVTASTTRAAYSWLIELDLVVDGKPVTIPIGPPNGFHTSAMDKNAAHWDWNYTNGWNAVGRGGRPLQRPTLHTGAPLPPL